jgi:hypothetical protein
MASLTDCPAAVDYFRGRVARFLGTLPPARRACPSAMAIACLQLVTFVRERPERNVPRLRSCIVFLIFSTAFFPYLAIYDLLCGLCVCPRWRLSFAGSGGRRVYRCDRGIPRQRAARRRAGARVAMRPSTASQSMLANTASMYLGRSAGL